MGQLPAQAVRHPSAQHLPSRPNGSRRSITVSNGQPKLYRENPGDARAVPSRAASRIYRLVCALSTHPEVDPDKIVLVGRSFGGYLAPRGAAGEPRLAAMIAYPGQYDIGRPRPGSAT